jgi:hypothetical protein
MEMWIIFLKINGISYLLNDLPHVDLQWIKLEIDMLELMTQHVKLFKITE